MRRFALACLIGFALAVTCAAAESTVHRGRTYVPVAGGWEMRENGSRYPVEPDVVSVRFRPELDGIDSFRRALLAQGGSAELAQLSVLRSNRLGIHDLNLMPGQDPLDVARRLEATGLVLYAEPSTVGDWVATPSDPRFPDQWHLRNLGQTGGAADADIDADDAWDTEDGAPSVVVAVIDSGTDIDHVDLQENLWKNPGEIAGNGEDDDDNGFTDDLDGWDFEANDPDPRSTNGHGTQVAGIVAARTDNGEGVSGIAGGFGSSGGVLLMPLKVGTGGPIGSVLDDAILYAADNGADIITLSLKVGESEAIDDALDYAYNEKGVFIDCASGNDYTGTVAYPARRPEVMAVGATSSDDERASFSNYGSDLEIVAPGVSILSTTLGNGYASGSGTSFAAPCVAGTAALVLSRNGALSAWEVRETLRETADDVGPPGPDLETGYGRVNARAAVDGVPPPGCVDGDGDGYFPIDGCGTNLDCDDGDETAYPGAPEICSDGIDQDCNGRDRTNGKGCQGENCNNKKDDDGDGLADCLDQDCLDNKACR